jgi:hypothetical protein
MLKAALVLEVILRNDVCMPFEIIDHILFHFFGGKIVVRFHI